MFKQYSSFVRNIFAGVKETDLVKLAIYTAVAAASSIWPVIALKDVGYGTSQALTVYAFDSWSGMFLLVFFSVFLHRRKLIKYIWFSVTWGSALGWFLLAVMDFDLALPLGMVVLFSTVIMTHLISVCLFADTLDQVQTGEAGAVKLALFFLLVPLCKIFFISIGGFLAEYSFMHVAAFLSAVLVCCNIVWRSHVVLHTVSVASTTRLWHAFDNKKRVLLILLSALFNSLSIPVRFVFVPLYFYEKTNGSPAKVGLALALLGVVALLAHASKKYMQGREINTFNLTVISFAAYACVPLVWYFNYDTVWVVGCALMVGQVLSVLWSFGFFAEFRKVTNNSPTMCTQQWQVANGFFIGIACFLLSLVADDMMAYIHTYLLVEFLVLVGAIAFFTIYWKRQL